MPLSSSGDDDLAGDSAQQYDTLLTTDVEEAASFIRRSHPVAFPTETVYGLGASVFDVKAIRRIYKAKGRPPSNPLIAHISDLSQLSALAATVSPAADRLISAFFPGPLTVVLPRADGVPDAATAGLDTIAIRMPDHDLARQLIAAAGSPLVAPSANRSGRPSPTTWEAVRDDLGGRIACILKGGRTQAGLESTVVDCTEDVPVLLRPGSLSVEALQDTVPDLVSGMTDDDRSARSPGMRFRHYAPDARVILIDSAAEAVPGDDHAFIGKTAPADAGAFSLVRVCASEEAYAYELFDFLRACDRRDVKQVYCQLPDPTGIGRALIDRLRRAAHFG